MTFRPKMSTEKADLLTQTLYELNDATISFRFNMEHQIMNGAPLRKMDTCKSTLLRAAESFDLPDPGTHNELYQYLKPVQEQIDEENLKKEQETAYKNSVEGKLHGEKTKIMNKMDLLARQREYCLKESQRHAVLAEQIQNDWNNCKSQLDALIEGCQYIPLHERPYF